MPWELCDEAPDRIALLVAWSKTRKADAVDQGLGPLPAIDKPEDIKSVLMTWAQKFGKTAK